MSTIKKMHHTTPKMHLKHFTGNQPKGNLWIYDKNSENPFSKPPSETGKQQYFYAVRKPDGTLDNRLEDFLGEIESKSNLIYENLLRGIHPRTAQERHDFSTFLALMYVRTPTMRRINAEMQGASIQSLCYIHTIHNFDETIKGVELKNGYRISPEQKERLKQAMLNPKDYKLSIPAERTLDALGIADSLTPMFEDMHWTILRSKHGFFVTSDNPLYKACDPETVRPFGGDGGFKNKTVEVTFPLSPQLSLLLTWVRYSLFPPSAKDARNSITSSRI